MTYTFWHSGILIGESDLEEASGNPGQHGGVFRPWENRRECGLRLLVCSIPRRERPGSPRFIVAEVDWRKIAYMSEHYMDPDEVIAWLGLSWSP